MYLDYLMERIEKGNKKICIFPMGEGGKGMLERLRTVGIDIDFFCDNNPKLWGTVYCGKKCISKQELIAQGSEVTVIIASSTYCKEIKKSLADEGIFDVERVYFEKIYAEAYVRNTPNVKKKINDVLNICEDDVSKDVVMHITSAWFADVLPDDYYSRIKDNDQYFDEDIIKLSSQEVFVDAGAYIGDTTENFLNHCGGQFEKIHLFELDPEIYRRLLKNLPDLQVKGNGILQGYPYGLSDHSQTVYFKSGERNSSIVEDETGKEYHNQTILTDGIKNTGKVVALDKVLEGENVTFIKMDIEGAEQAALRGAEKIIKSKYPKLAICVYHNPEDILEIPLWIKHLVPEYKIYFRHYSNDIAETVCYAVMD